jgi:hypothetical protein
MARINLNSEKYEMSCRLQHDASNNEIKYHKLQQ